MNMFRKSLAALLGCALFATTALVADAGLVSQVAVLTFGASAAGVVATADESPVALQGEVIPERVLDKELIPDRVLQMETPSAAPTGAPTEAPGGNSPASGAAAMFVGGGASKAAVSCALAVLAGGAMAAAV